MASGSRAGFPRVPAGPLTQGMTFAMTTAAGIAMAIIHDNQPMLGIIEGDLVALAA